MYPAIPPPANSNILRPVDFKLKAGWRFDEATKLFIGPAGEKFSPSLPADAKVVFKVPDLARAKRRDLSTPEKDLQRYMQVILPTKQKPAAFAGKVRKWPCADQVHPAPEVSLPTAPQPPKGAKT